MSRLEEITRLEKLSIKYFQNSDGEMTHRANVIEVYERDYRFLVQQAERVKELEEKLKLEKGVHLNFESYLREENQRYKQALEEIRDTHFPDTNTTAHDVANEALKGDTNDRRASV